MMFDKTDKIALRQIIMEHYINPDFKKLVDDKNAVVRFQDSPTCADEINVQILIEENIVKAARFDGNGCSISTAATDILCSMLTGKKINEAKAILLNYYNMITGKEYDEESLDELIVFWEINKHGNRINCALLGADGFRDILSKEGD